MRIRTLFIMSIIIFGVAISLIALSMIMTDRQVAQLNKQEELVHSLQLGVNDLSYYSNNYLLYRESQQLTRWNSKFTSLSTIVSNLNPVNPEQESAINNVKVDMQRLNSTLIDIESILERTPQNESIITNSAFQVSWSRLAVQNQGLAFDAAQLSYVLSSQINQLKQTNLNLIFVLLGVFSSFFIVNYLIVYHRTLNSVSALQTGIEVIGSGNLDYIIKMDRRDEIGELSHAFNKMTTHLKQVTASRIELEKEIVQRKKAEEALRESEERFFKAFHYSPIASTIASLSDGRWIEANESFLKLTGYSHEEVIGHTSTELGLYDDDQNERTRIMDTLRTQGKINNFELSARNRDRKPLRLLLSAVKLNLNDQDYLLSMTTDITEQRKLEEQVKNMERFSAIGQTAAMVGHDLRNPLQGIVGELSLSRLRLERLECSADKKKDFEESLESIHEQVFYMDKIVSDLQDYARPINPKMFKTNLRELVDKTLQETRIPKTITVSNLVPADLYILVDSELMKRLFVNLFNNAVDAMPTNGELTISSSNGEGRFEISVQDTGIGIPQENFDRLFTPLFTTKSKGQGFGLAVCKRIIEAHNGSIIVESEVGSGTTFRIVLPKTLEEY